MRLMDFNILEVRKHPWQMSAEQRIQSCGERCIFCKGQIIMSLFLCCTDPLKNQDKFPARILKGPATMSLGHFIGAVRVCYRIQGYLLCSVNCLH